MTQSGRVGSSTPGLSLITCVNQLTGKALLQRDLVLHSLKVLLDQPTFSHNDGHASPVGQRPCLTQVWTP